MAPRARQLAARSGIIRSSPCNGYATKYFLAAGVSRNQMRRISTKSPACRVAVLAAHTMSAFAAANALTSELS
jgi:hypothetical protein